MPVLIDAPSVQLYTVRSDLQTDAQATLWRLAELGYRRVEPYKLLDFADVLGPALADTGLSAPTAHARLLDGRHDEVFEAAARLGVGTVIDPMIDSARWTSGDQIARIVDDLAEVADRAGRVGLRVGYHNHAYELSTRIEGRSALEVFADLLPPEIVLELDTYWAAVGGEDPVALVKRLGERVRFLHLKDGPVSRENKAQVAVGSGAMPITELIAATPWLELGVVELDDHDGDVWKPVADSLRFLTGDRPGSHR